MCSARGQEPAGSHQEGAARQIASVEIASFRSIRFAGIMPRVAKMTHRKQRPVQGPLAKPPEQPERPDDQTMPRSEQASVAVVETHRFSHEELAQLLWCPDFVATMLRELLLYREDRGA